MDTSFQQVPFKIVQKKVGCISFTKISQIKWKQIWCINTALKNIDAKFKWVALKNSFYKYSLYSEKFHEKACHNPIIQITILKLPSNTFQSNTKYSVSA